MSRRRGRLHKLTPCRSIEAHRLAVAWLKLSGRRSSLTVHNQVCLSLPVLRRQSLGGPRMHADLKSSRMGLTGVGTTKVAKERQALSTDSIWQEWLIRTRPNHGLPHSAVAISDPVGWTGVILVVPDWTAVQAYDPGTSLNFSIGICAFCDEFWREHPSPLLVLGCGTVCQHCCVWHTSSVPPRTWNIFV